MWMILSIWTHGEYKLQNFLSHLNGIHSKIKFTMGIENRNQLPFLDVLIIKKQDGTLGLSILKSNPYQPLPQYAITSPSRRVTRSGKNSSVNISTIKTYTESQQFHHQHHKHAKTNPMDTTTYVTKEYLLYIKGTTDKIDRILWKHQFQTIFSAERNIGQILNKLKHRIPLKAHTRYPTGSPIFLI
ncbi:hypothetical protein Trydic_g16796 [Trypoxylus dichotomus]